MVYEIDLKNLEKICAAQNEDNYYFLKALALVGINAMSYHTAFCLTGSKVLSSAFGYIMGQFSPKFFGEGFLSLMEKGCDEISNFNDIANDIDLSSAIEEYELEKMKIKR